MYGFIISVILDYMLLVGKLQLFSDTYWETCIYCENINAKIKINGYGF